MVFGMERIMNVGGSLSVQEQLKGVSEKVLGEAFADVSRLSLLN